MLNGLPASSWISAVRRAISCLHQPGEALQLDGIDADAGALHARQHARQRQLDGGVKLAQAARVDGRRELIVDLERDIGVLLGRGAELQVEAASRLLVERAAGGVGVEEEGVQHHVVVEAARLDAHAVERQQRGFHVAGDLRPRLRLRATVSGTARFSVVTARASPGVRARPMVSSANSPSADFEIATACALRPPCAQPFLQLLGPARRRGSRAARVSSPGPSSFSSE